MVSCSRRDFGGPEGGKKSIVSFAESASVLGLVVLPFAVTVTVTMTSSYVTAKGSDEERRGCVFAAYILYS